MRPKAGETCPNCGERTIQCPGCTYIGTPDEPQTQPIPGKLLRFKIAENIFWTELNAISQEPGGKDFNIPISRYEVVGAVNRNGHTGFLRVDVPLDYVHLELVDEPKKEDP